MKIMFNSVITMLRTNQTNDSYFRKLRFLLLPVLSCPKVISFQAAINQMSSFPSRVWNSKFIYVGRDAFLFKESKKTSFQSLSFTECNFIELGVLISRENKLNHSIDKDNVKIYFFLLNLPQVSNLLWLTRGTSSPSCKLICWIKNIKLISTSRLWLKNNWMRTLIIWNILIKRSTNTFEKSAIKATRPHKKISKDPEGKTSHTKEAHMQPWYNIEIHKAASSCDSGPNDLKWITTKEEIRKMLMKPNFLWLQHL